MFPQQYRPKAMEERIRRNNIKQLEMQLESITAVRKALTPLAEKDKVLEPEGVSREGRRHPSMSRANSDMTDVTGEGAKASPSAGVKGIALHQEEEGEGDGAGAGTSANASTATAAAAATAATSSTNPNTSDGAMSILETDTAGSGNGSQAATPPPAIKESSVESAGDAAADTAAVDSVDEALSRAQRELALSEDDGEPDPELERALRDFIGGAASADSQEEGEGVNDVVAIETRETDHPHGGRIGKELAKAIEADQYFGKQEEEMMQVALSNRETDAVASDSEQKPTP